MNLTDTFIPIPSVPAGTYQDRYYVVNITTTATELLEEMFDELEWDKTFHRPNVLRGLRALAEKALKDFEAGETEEGGFIVE